jgi:hypothetical protein
MTTGEPRPHQPIARRTFVALGLNIMASVGLWAVAFTVNTSESLTRALLILPASLVVALSESRSRSCLLAGVVRTARLE